MAEQLHLQGVEQLVIRLPPRGCLGLAPIRGSKQCGMDILTNVLIETGIQSSDVNGFFGPLKVI